MADNEKKKSKKKRHDFRVINVRADGTIQESMEGVIVPYNEQTEALYRLLVKLAFES